MKTFTAKVRPIGTSLGILLPKEIAKESKIKKGERIEVSILKRDLRLLRKAFGIAKGTSKFERERIERKL